jgi:phospholipase C
VRVPAVVVSPWARPHFVSHATHDHTSILRFIETRFGLPALTRRDAPAVVNPAQTAACAAIPAAPGGGV